MTQPEQEARAEIDRLLAALEQFRLIASDLGAKETES